MIIQGGSSHLNQQNTRSQRSSDSNSFEDFLLGSKDKKKESSLQKESVVAKKKENKEQPLNSENKMDQQDQKTFKSDKKSDEKVQSLENNQKQVQAKEPSDSKEKLVEKVSKDESKVLDNKKIEDILLQTHNFDLADGDSSVLADGSSLKNFETNEESQNALLSLNLSAVENKTLGKNEKIISDFENQVARLMQEQGQAQPQEVTSLQTLNPQAGAALNGQQNSLKIENALKEITDENSLAELDSQLKALAIEGSDSQTSDLKDDKADMESLFTQYTEQEAKLNASENNQFVDELNQLNGETKAEKVENMQSIIKQAKAIVDDGGGTMEIHMQPEGLGKVHLKVAVQNGQVSVEMQTDNLAAKRALEEGLLDMKQALEGHKLLVETLKVEMAPDYQKDFSDLSNHMQEQANRDFAEQFLGQFRQEREERMGGLFDGFRNFQRNSKEPDLVLSQRNPYAENGKGRTLNVVA